MSLIESLAGTQHQTTWDEASLQEPGFKKDPNLRAMYAQIPCKHGVLYEFSENDVAWMCQSPRVVRRTLKEKPDWLNVFVDCRDKDDPMYDEAVFTFHRDHFQHAAKMAGAKRRRGGANNKRLAEARNKAQKALQKRS